MHCLTESETFEESDRYYKKTKHKKEFEYGQTVIILRDKN